MAAGEYEELSPEIRGLIPQGEKIVWADRPDWMSLAYRSFGLKYLIGYFAICALYVAANIDGAFEAKIFLLRYLPFVISGCIAGIILTLIAYFEAIYTDYVLTERRVIIKSGVALVFVLNAPFKKIESIDRQSLSKGRGNIAFSVLSARRLPYFSCWPSVKPWSLRSPIPSFRSIREVAKVELLLVEIAKSNNEVNKVEVSDDEVLAV